MKSCPKCSRVYADDALNFCLDDGEWLAPFEANESVTAILSGDPVKEAPTRKQLTETDPPSGSATVDLQKPAWWKRPVLIAPILVVILIAAGFGIYKFVIAATSAKKLSFESAKITRLTNNGKVLVAAISPDGKYVVYVQDDGDQQSLWLRQTNAPSNVQIVPPANVYYHGMTFSPDGDHVYYTIHEKADYVGALYEVATLGGSPQKILTDILSPISFSPDGKQFAFIRQPSNEKRQMLMIADSVGKNERILTERNGPDVFSVEFVHGPIWSPDGKTIVCPFSNVEENWDTLVAIDVASGKVNFFTQRRWLDERQIAWLPDGSGILTTVTDEGFEPFQIWKVAFPSGEAERFTNDLSNYQSVSVSSTANTLVTVPIEYESNVWLTTLSAPATHAAQITNGRNRILGISWAPDGRIVYGSTAGGNMDIWINDAHGGNAKQLTANARFNAGPFVTPDGKFILFWSDRTGAVRLWRMNFDGSDQKPLTESGGDEPSVSPDSQWVYYVGYEADIAYVRRIAINGGPPQQITEKPSIFPVTSHDGKQLACFYQDKPGIWALALFSPDGGQPIKVIDLPDATPTNLRWSADDRLLLYGLTRDGVTNLWAQPTDGSPPKQATDFKSDNFRWFDISADGKQLAFSRGTVTKDAVLISNFR